MFHQGVAIAQFSGFRQKHLFLIVSAIHAYTSICYLSSS
jgi:hypothetical protein